jgi:hypothetical protein
MVIGKIENMVFMLQVQGAAINYSFIYLSKINQGKQYKIGFDGRRAAISSIYHGAAGV